MQLIAHVRNKTCDHSSKGSCKADGQLAKHIKLFHIKMLIKCVVING